MTNTDPLDSPEAVRIDLDEALRELRRRSTEAARLNIQIASLTNERDALRKRCRDLETARDAWMETAHRALAGERLRDATDPGPQLVAEERAAFPARALIGGDGVFHG